MESRFQRCRCVCQVYGCADVNDEDPDMHLPVQGRLLPPSTAAQHRRDDKIWRSGQYDRDPESALLTSILAAVDRHQEDFVVNRRASHADTRSAEIANVSRSAKTNGVQEATEDARQEGACLPVDETRDNINTDVRAALQKLAHYAEWFRTHQAAFSGIAPNGLKFEEKNHETPEVPPKLDPKGSHPFILHQETTEKILELVNAVKSQNVDQVPEAQQALVQDIRVHQAFLDRLVQEQWLRRRLEKVMISKDLKEKIPSVVEPTSHYTALDTLNYVAYPLLISILIASALHIFGHASRNHTNFLLVVLRVLIVSTLTKFLADTVNTTSGKGQDGRLGDQVEALASGWPEDIRTAMRIFDLDPNLVGFAACAKCFTLYGPINEDSTSHVDMIPDFCTFRETPSSPPCGMQLLREEGKKRVPISRYFFQPLASWLARMLSRPEIARSLRSDLKSPSGTMRDIWDGELLHSIIGSDGRPFFELPPESSELRLGFSLFIDWFNPYGSKQGGKHVSVGAIYMVCHNLPIHLRYRIENIYLAGIIPGPHEPSQHHLNHLLSPLVDELLKLWSPGVHIARTASNDFGSLIRCVVAPLVCDLLAMRKASGFAGHGTHSGRLCSFCLQDVLGISSTDVKSWRRRSWKEHLAIARLWKDAPNETIRNGIYKEHGIRWSELLRLPYWDPTRFAVVDAMHNFFLGDLQHHCRAILGMNADIAALEDKRVQPHDPDEQQRQLDYGIAAIRAVDKAALNRLRRGYIVSLAQANNVSPEILVETSGLKRSRRTDHQVGKERYTDALITWAKNCQGNLEIRCPRPFPRPVIDLALAWSDIRRQDETILNRAILMEVWADMAKTILPSWIGRAPRNLGSSSHGKLKADQWRTACLVNLVITLCRLWGKPGATARETALLQNFLSIVIAVRWATMRSITPAHIAIVEDHLEYYMKSTTAIFGEGALVVNNHASMHIPECLRSFGPVHSWWAFPFERYNGIIQRLNSNNKLGQMEETLMRTFCRGANLRALLARDTLPEAMELLRPLVSKYFGSALNGATVAESLPLDPNEVVDDLPSSTAHEPLDDSLYRALTEYLNSESPLSHQVIPDRFVQYRRYITFKGVTFATASHHVGNSLILFRTEANGAQRAGQIHKIFIHVRRHPSENKSIKEYFYAIREFQELDGDEAAHDPYRAFTLLETRLSHADFLPDEIAIRPSDVVSHFVACPYKIDGLEGEYQVVLSLNRD